MCRTLMRCRTVVSDEHRVLKFKASVQFPIQFQATSEHQKTTDESTGVAKVRQSAAQPRLLLPESLIGMADFEKIGMTASVDSPGLGINGWELSVFFHR